jgi:alpha-beta hydrolase superfamily lysophospholipase
MTDPNPMFFGPENDSLFGWYHAVAEKNSSDFGMVICNPFGFEEVSAHKSLRALATEASESGIPAIRFDYYGCGNSSGDEFDAHTVRRWIDSIHLAIDTLKRLSGVRSVCLLGIRLGAALAATAATERSDIHGLVALAPVIKGRAYIRELRVLGHSGADDPNNSGSAGVGLEAAGFVMSTEATNEISQINLEKLSRLPAERILVVDRDDLAIPSNWAAHLRQLGASVQVEQWPGYHQMMQDPQRSHPPLQIISGLLSVLANWQCRTAAANLEIISSGTPVDNAPEGSFLINGRHVREVPVHVPTESSMLFGIMTSSSELDREGGPMFRSAVVMINSGAVHHIGPNRLWVQLARRWATRNVAVLRLDLSGLGDSPARSGCEEDVVYSASALDDIGQALKYCRNLVGEAGQVHLVGLCSGAYHALKSAVSGHQWTSAVMINPLTFFWLTGTPVDNIIKDYEVIEKSSNYGRKLLSMEPWKKLLRGQMNLKYVVSVLWRRVQGVIQPHALEFARIIGMQLADDLAAELKHATTNAGTLKFVFSVGEPGHELLRKQSGRTLQRLIDAHKISVTPVSNADHTFTRLESRNRLLPLLDEFVLANHRTPDCNSR